MTRCTVGDGLTLMRLQSNQNVNFWRSLSEWQRLLER